MAPGRLVPEETILVRLVTVYWRTDLALRQLALRPCERLAKGTALIVDGRTPTIADVAP
ncbi:hypothetical protein AB0948_03165 [Streptomyces koyangensis]|uniref:hypothetical protein n=1 Tax=Streptomyces koyangensis TaxID=188770 RepID=UPI0034540B68